MDKQRISLRYFWWPLKGPVGSVDVGKSTAYLELVYLVTALVPSDTACLANSPGRRRRTAVWISREVMVDLETNTDNINTEEVTSCYNGLAC